MSSCPVTSSRSAVGTSRSRFHDPPAARTRPRSWPLVAWAGHKPRESRQPPVHRRSTAGYARHRRNRRRRHPRTGGGRGRDVGDLLAPVDLSPHEVTVLVDGEHVPTDQPVEHDRVRVSASSKAGSRRCESAKRPRPTAGSDERSRRRGARNRCANGPSESPATERSSRFRVVPGQTQRPKATEYSAHSCSMTLTSTPSLSVAVAGDRASGRRSSRPHSTGGTDSRPSLTRTCGRLRATRVRRGASRRRGRPLSRESPSRPVGVSSTTRQFLDGQFIQRLSISSVGSSNPEWAVALDYVDGFVGRVTVGDSRYRSPATMLQPVHASASGVCTVSVTTYVAVSVATRTPTSRSRLSRRRTTATRPRSGETRVATRRRVSQREHAALTLAKAVADDVVRHPLCVGERDVGVHASTTRAAGLNEGFDQFLTSIEQFADPGIAAGLGVDAELRFRPGRADEHPRPVSSRILNPRRC